ncbi:MAG: M23 family peptidase [Bacteroidetes bacterium]|nr:MAG: M23 family peptidase [Bacteroidota bacterium]
MPVESKKEKRKRRIERLRNKYRLVVMNEDTYEEKVSFRLSRLNVFTITGITTIFLIILTTLLIAFTPLREYIPGYTDVTMQRRIIELQDQADSLQKDVEQKNVFLRNLLSVIEGKEIVEDTTLQQTGDANYDNIEYSRSPEDSILRAEYENEGSYDLYYNENEELTATASTLSSYLFFTPLKGIVTTKFELAQQHFGVDVVAKRNEAVKATLDGTVIFSDWTIETGYVISIQHQGNFISIYKHNSVLLKKMGSIVKAGEPIAIVGESGELTTGPHLHFELWYNGTPVDPMDYIVF